MAQIAGFQDGDCEDFLQDFDFEDESLSYHDGPVAGFLLLKGSGDRFAFSVQFIVDHKLWHWTIVPAANGTDPDQCLSNVDSTDCPYWISVVEDRRLEQRCTVAIMHSDSILPKVPRVAYRV